MKSVSENRPKEGPRWPVRHECARSEPVRSQSIAPSIWFARRLADPVGTDENRPGSIIGRFPDSGSNGKSRHEPDSGVVDS